MFALSNLDKPVARFEARQYSRPLREQPIQQLRIGGVANTQPDDDRGGVAEKATLREVFVFSDDREFVVECISPYNCVRGIPQPNLPYGNSITALQPQCGG